MKLIGKGNTANVYELGDQKVLKLYHEGFPKEVVEQEYNNSIKINGLLFPKPKAYKMIEHEKQYGIIYDQVEGETSLDMLFKSKDVKQCAKNIAELHKQILRCNSSHLQDYKEMLLSFIVRAPENLKEKRKQALEILDKLPDGTTVCHGDFHPGNVLITNQGSVVIDFMNICSGTRCYDVARTVYLIEYTPVAKEMEDLQEILWMKHTLAEYYLQEMNITREEIADYLRVIEVVRRVECPGEFED